MCRKKPSKGLPMTSRAVPGVDGGLWSSFVVGIGLAGVDVVSSVAVLD